jgi:signal peptidase I
VESILGNKAMLVVIVAFGITIMVVYLIRRMPVNHSWTIAMIAGAMMNVIILLIGDLLYDVNLSVAGVLFGSLLALAVGKVVEFFRFCVDYGRTERVQFEDDEYYYYVKAVPKMTVQVSTRTVKKINSQRARGNPAEARSAAGRQTARPAGRGAAAEAAGRRSISRQASYPRSRSDDQRKGRSLTIGNAENVEDYEESMDEAMMDEMMPDMTDNPDENGDWQ